MRWMVAGARLPAAREQKESAILDTTWLSPKRENDEN